MKFAKKDIRIRLKNGEEINHVWRFFDKDDFPKKNFIQAHTLIIDMNDSKDVNADGFKYNLETEISWHSCYSNESFELWYCLYFNFITSAHTRKDYKEFLDKKLKKDGPYSKTKVDMHQHLTNNGGNIKDAIKNAKKLFRLNDLSNPSTGVYQFAEYFIPYMK